MSPRGVAITDVRERLFAAAERVLARQGPSGLTNRAITTEAGCAKGLLYNHFADLEDFLAQLVVHRFAQLAAQVGALSERAGQATVAENLTSAALGLLGEHGPAFAAAAISRAGVAERVRDAMEQGAPAFSAIEDSVTAYLEAERSLGRISPDADTAALALALVGATHHLLMTSWPGAADPADRLRRLIIELTRDMAS